jgi:hypothetical protein
MIEQPPLDEAWRLRVIKIDLRILLECLRRCLSSVRNNPMNQFKTITVRLVFTVTGLMCSQPE